MDGPYYPAISDRIPRGPPRAEPAPGGQRKDDEGPGSRGQKLRGGRRSEGQVRARAVLAGAREAGASTGPARGPGAGSVRRGGAGGPYRSAGSRRQINYGLDGSQVQALWKRDAILCSVPLGTRGLPYDHPPLDL